MYYQQNTQNKHVGGHASFDSASLEQLARTNFIKKVYTLLSLQLLITVLAISLVQKYPFLMKLQGQHSWLLIVNIIATIGISIALTMNRTLSMKSPYNYLLLGAFTLAQSYLVSFICSIYTPKSVLMCGVLTLSVTVGLTLHAISCKTNYSALTGSACGFMSLLLGLAFINWFIRSSAMSNLLAVGFAGVYMVYILVDTQLIMGKKDHKLSLDNYVMGTIMLYLDIVTLFLKLLQLFGERKRDD